MNIILASSSKRRKDILDIFNIKYNINTSDVKEILDNKPEVNSLTNAFLKADDVYKKEIEKIESAYKSKIQAQIKKESSLENIVEDQSYEDISREFSKTDEIFNLESKKEKEIEDVLVIGADTVVSIEDESFGKPKDKNENIVFLKKLSGKTHKVTTGYCILTKRKKYTDYVNTYVTFKKLDDEIINSYVKTEDGMGKAGGYTLQGIGSILIEKIQGDYYNVIGLPISDIYDKLKLEFNIDLLNLN